MFKTVLFPIDLSLEAEQAVDAVIDIVKTYGSRLVLLSVVESPSEEDGVATAEQASPEAVAKLLQRAQAQFSENGITSEAIERSGKPAFVICDVADEINANLIVMGCRGMGLIEEACEDSVTTRVINLSPCPVLVVP